MLLTPTPGAEDENKAYQSMVESFYKKNAIMFNNAREKFIQLVKQGSDTLDFNAMTTGSGPDYNLYQALVLDNSFDDE